MKRIKIHFNGSEYDFGWVEALVLVGLVLFCNQLNIADKNSQLVSDLNRQRTAAEMRAHTAEKQLASTLGQPSPGVVIITPEGKSVHSVEPPKTYTNLQRDVAF